MAVQLSLFSILERILSMPYNAAASISYIGAIYFHFTLNRRLTFKARNGLVLSHAKRYITVAVINYVLMLTVLNATVRIFSLSPLAGLIASVGTTFLTGFLLMKRWVFRHEQ